MRSRLAVGKRIVAIEHERINSRDGARKAFVHVARIVLEDGTVLVTHAIETGLEPVGDLLVVGRKRPKDQLPK